MNRRMKEFFKNLVNRASEKNLDAIMEQYAQQAIAQADEILTKKPEPPPIVGKLEDRQQKLQVYLSKNPGDEKARSTLELVTKLLEHYHAGPD